MTCAINARTVVTPFSALARIRIGFPIFLLLDCFYQ
jgi:hypothetical protein